MAKRELIYKDEARRAVLQNTPNIAWCIDRINPVAVVDDGANKISTKIDEYWIARIQYWPTSKPQIDVIMISHVWENGDINFIPFNSLEGDIVRSGRCAQFELLERIKMEKYE